MTEGRQTTDRRRRQREDEPTDRRQTDNWSRTARQRTCNKRSRESHHRHVDTTSRRRKFVCSFVISSSHGWMILRYYYAYRRDQNKSECMTKHTSELDRLPSWSTNKPDLNSIEIVYVVVNDGWFDSFTTHDLGEEIQ